MTTYKYKLADFPEERQAREVWLQHAAGFILFQDVRQYAIDQIDPDLNSSLQAQIIKGIDNALYGLMMVFDGVSGHLRNDQYEVYLKTMVILAQRSGAQKQQIVDHVNLFDGDGMCMGVHGWQEGDFGQDEIVTGK